jgi:hypothetical protein
MTTENQLIFVLNEPVNLRTRRHGSAGEIFGKPWAVKAMRVSANMYFWKVQIAA